MKARLRLLVLSLALASMLAGGCFRGGPRMALTALNVAATVVEIAAVAAVLAHHDGHYHADHCHPVRYYDGREVYYYNNQWEYYDHGSSNWYVYAE